LRAIACLLVAALLSACATTREKTVLPDLPTWSDRVYVLGGLEDWEFRGRIGVKAGDDGFNGKVRWIQDGDAFTATVGGPIGIGTVRIAGDGESAVLTDKDGVETVLDNAESDLKRRFGWRLPVSSLRFWALGIPEPGLPAETEFDGDGMLIGLGQRGWDVRITRYKAAGGQPMPFRLTAKSSDTTVRLVVDSWFFFK
jgi:outer membrane lipoprotein LolB